MNGFEVYSEQCKNCLLSKDRIVSGQRAREIIQGCITSGSYFICHKASLSGKETACRGFYDAFEDRSQIIQVAKRLGVVREVPQPDNTRLPSHRDMNKTKS